MWYQVRSVQVGLGQIRSGQFNSDQVRSGQVKMSWKGFGTVTYCFLLFLWGSASETSGLVFISLEGSMEAEAEAVDGRLKEAEAKKQLTAVASLKKYQHFCYVNCDIRRRENTFDLNSSRKCRQFIDKGGTINISTNISTLLIISCLNKSRDIIYKSSIVKLTIQNFNIPASRCMDQVR